MKTIETTNNDGGFVDATGRYVSAKGSDSSCCSGETHS